MASPEELDTEELDAIETQGVDEVVDTSIEDVEYLAPATPINPDMTKPSPEAEIPKPKFNFKDSTLGKYLMEKNNVQLEIAKNIGRGFGRVGLRLLNTLKSDDLSIAQKVEGSLAGVVDAAGEVVKASVQMGSVGGLLHLVPGEATGKATDAFINGAVDSASGIVAERTTDKSGKEVYGFNEAGVAQFVNPKGLVTVGVEAAVGGIDGAMASVHESTKDSESEAAKKFNEAYDVYDSKTGRVIKRVAKNAAVKHLNSKSAYDKAA